MEADIMRELDDMDVSEEQDEDLDAEDANMESGDDEPFIPPLQREDAPLAGILRADLQNVDPRTYFPDFGRKRILRFSRMFGVNPKTLNQNMIWWPSKTFFKKLEQQKQKADQQPGDTAPEQPSTSEQSEFRLNIGPAFPKDLCVTDQTELLLKSEAELEAMHNAQHDEDDEPPPWRFGPAQMWYDRLGLPDNPRRFDYGFKTNQFNIITSTSKKPVATHAPSSEDLLPVNLLHWEDDIIMDGSEIKTEEIMKREPKCGWISTQQTRNYQAYKATVAGDDSVHGPDQTHSIFPTENYELENTRWEDDIILDPDNMPAIPKPRVLTIEYEDDPTIFGMPEDISYDEKARDESGRGPAQKDSNFTKKSKMILGQVQRRQKQEEEEHMESSTAQNADKDVFNMSNDDYYAPKNVHRAIGSGSAIQHSIPAQNIHHAIFPTHLDVFHLRHWHRLPASERVMRELIKRERDVRNALRFIAEAEERRKNQMMLDSGTEIFHMRTLRDLSARDGTLICIEYSEEHPPLLSQPGMASKIRNYYKRKSQKESDPQCEFGEPAFTMNSPFLGTLNPGQCLQALENNMYRAPIFKHKPRHTDFILIRCSEGLLIRECPALFVAGQECPLYEVPSPNSKRANVFGRDFLMAFIYRLFWESDHQPKRIRMEDIREAFPEHAETSIRKRLKQCSDFKRMGTGQEQSFWVLKEDFRLPSKEEVLSMLTPEMCCAHYSMLAAEQRLKDAGYGEKYFLTPENEDDPDDQVTMEDEIKCAPWNTTRAYISASKGKCLLDQTGIADPTGSGQGFSYVRVTQKPQKEDLPQMPKRLVTGTNADLRKLPLKEAKDICRSYGVREEEINALTRWEIIDVIRTLSTQAAKTSADFTGMGRFARGNIRFNSADAHEKYKKYCQHVFDLQNKNLACAEELSTDEGSDNEDSDNEMASHLEKMLDKGKDSKKVGRGNLPAAINRKITELEEEERERRDLQRLIHGDDPAKAADKVDKKDAAEKAAADAQPTTDGGQVKKLRIYRVIRGQDGAETTRVEIVNNQQVIDAYDKIRKNRDADFINVYAHMDEQYKEEKRKEKRRIQDQLRRIKRNEQKSKQGASPIGRPKKKPTEKKPQPFKPNLAMKCSNCGQVGHMKTNKNCPLYDQYVAKKKETTIGDIRSNASSSALDELNLPGGELTTLEGTKFKISQKLIEHMKEQKKKALTLRIPTEFINKQKSTAVTAADEPKSSTTSKHQPPSSSTQLQLQVEVADQDSSNMDDSLLPSASTSRLEMPSPASTAGSTTRRSTASHYRRRGTIEEADYLMGPMKSVQRRRADPRVSMAIILSDIYSQFKNIPNIEPLLKPVDPRRVPDYYEKIEKPMSLQEVKNKITSNAYELRGQFLGDLALILNNSKRYNSESHPITQAANRVLDVALNRIKEKEARLIELEKAINPLLDENDIVGFSYILNDIVQHCKNVPKSALFHTKVDARKYPQYYERIQTPMDLGAIEQKVKQQQYRTVDAFLADVEQIYKNSLEFNGETHLFTLKAREILDVARKHVDEKRSELQELQSRIEAPAAAASDQQSVVAEEEEEEEEEEEDGIGADDEMEDGEATRDTAAAMFGERGSHAGEEEMEVDDGGEETNIMMPTDEDTMDAWDHRQERASTSLVESQMYATGQLNADLALSDSSDDEANPKRTRLDEDLDDL